MKALVLGAGGQLGSELVQLLPDAVGFSHHELSVSDPAGIEAACLEYQPEVLFNCAAYNAVVAKCDPSHYLSATVKRLLKSCRGLADLDC